MTTKYSVETHLHRIARNLWTPKRDFSIIPLSPPQNLLLLTLYSAKRVPHPWPSMLVEIIAQN
jgi:hypothetical protein